MFHVSENFLSKQEHIKLAFENNNSYGITDIPARETYKNGNRKKKEKKELEYHIKYLYKSSTTVKIEMEILNLPKLAKSVLEIFFLSLLMHSSNQHNPSLNCCHINNSKSSSSIFVLM